jgi:putative endonuclease
MFAWLKRSKAEPKRTMIGRLGEEEAERLLKAKGYRVVARNWRAGKDEIDLVCYDGEVLVFVETRTRSVGALVGGFDSIDKRKREALKRVCRAYVAKLKSQPATYRLDVVEVEHEEGEILVSRHFENTPLFSKSAGRGN